MRVRAQREHGQSAEHHRGPAMQARIADPGGTAVANSPVGFGKYIAAKAEK